MHKDFMFDSVYELAVFLQKDCRYLCCTETFCKLMRLVFEIRFLTEFALNDSTTPGLLVSFND